MRKLTHGYLLKKYMKYLILGNGAAGTTAADKLRELDKDGEIKLISADDSVAYAKIMLPDYIGGKIAREKLFLRNENYYNEKKIELIRGMEVTKFNFDENYVELENGAKEYYDKLLIATGSKPFIPSIPGLNDIDYFTINSLKDADLLKSKAKEGLTAIVLGGGLTGIEICFALARLGVKPYLVEKNNCILASQLNEVATGIMQAWMKKDGINILTGMSLQELAKCLECSESSELPENSETALKRNKAIFTDNQTIPFDLFVFAIGTRPNVLELKDTNISINRGILVDKCMHTNIKNVFAAGDIAELENGQVPGYVSTYIWPNAMAQGKCAAFNMCGQEMSLSSNGSAINPTQLRDMPFYSMGLVKPKDPENYEIIEHADDINNIYKRIILKDNVIKGFILIGDTGLARKYTSLLKENTDISDIKSTKLLL